MADDGNANTPISGSSSGLHLVTADELFAAFVQRQENLAMQDRGEAPPIGLSIYQAETNAALEQVLKHIAVDELDIALGAYKQQTDFANRGIVGLSMETADRLNDLQKVISMVNHSDDWRIATPQDDFNPNFAKQEDHNNENKIDLPITPFHPEYLPEPKFDYEEKQVDLGEMEANLARQYKESHPGDKDPGPLWATPPTNDGGSAGEDPPAHFDTLRDEQEWVPDRVETQVDLGEMEANLARQYKESHPGDKDPGPLWATPQTNDVVFAGEDPRDPYNSDGDGSAA